MVLGDVCIIYNIITYIYIQNSCYRKLSATHILYVYTAWMCTVFTSRFGQDVATIAFSFASSSIEVIFFWGCLPLRSSSVEVIFGWGRLPLRFSSIEVVFHWPPLPLTSTSKLLIPLYYIRTDTKQNFRSIGGGLGLHQTLRNIRQKYKGNGHNIEHIFFSAITFCKYRKAKKISWAEA